MVMDKKDVVMDLATARNFYKDATPELKRWLECNFTKDELINDDYVPLVDIDVPGWLGRDNPLFQQVLAGGKLLAFMRDYYCKTLNVMPESNFVTIVYDFTLMDFVIRDFNYIVSPFVFKKASHAAKFLNSYRELLLDYFYIDRYKYFMHALQI